MNKILFISDIHIGLNTDGIDRTNEIIGVIKTGIVRRAKKLKKEGHNIAVVFGGDIFHKNTPNEYQVASFIRILNLFSRLGTKVYVMSGNHDSISDEKRLSCLSFIKYLSKVYNFVTLIDDITSVEFCTVDSGKYNLVFLPHINNAHLAKDGDNYDTTQEYIDGKTQNIIGDLPVDNSIMFTHLDISGAIAGDESNFLNKSTVKIPEFIIDNDKNSISKKPFIVSGHIHKHQEIHNIHIVGSPIYTDFSDSEMDKYYAEITIPDDMYKTTEIKYHKTKCTDFVNIAFSTQYIDSGVSVTDAILRKIKKTLNKGRGFVKVELEIEESKLAKLDTKKIEAFTKKFNFNLKPMTPKIISKRKPVRNEEMKIGNNPKESLKEYLKSDSRIDRSMKKEILKLGVKYIEDVL